MGLDVAGLEIVRTGGEIKLQKYAEYVVSLILYTIFQKFSEIFKICLLSVTNPKGQCLRLICVIKENSKSSPVWKLAVMHTFAR